MKQTIIYRHGVIHLVDYSDTLNKVTSLILLAGLLYQLLFSSSMKGNNKRFWILLPSVVISVLAIVGVVSAATTIGTDISTDGTLFVTGSSTLSDLTITGTCTGCGGGSFVSLNPSGDQTVTGAHSLIFSSNDVSTSTNDTLIQIGNDNPGLVERGFIRVTPYTTTQYNTHGFGGIALYPEFDPGNGVAMGGDGGLSGVYGAVQLDSGHTNDALAGVWSYAENDSSDASQTPWLADFYAESPVNGGNSPNQAGLYIKDQRGFGSAASNTFAIWAAEPSGSGNTDYFSWFDSQGVLRVKEDRTFDGGNAQAIQALYNPRFTKYTPGATNYERLILGEWNSNVVEIGTENGGSGSARALGFITASTTRMTIGSTGNVGIGTTSPATKFDISAGANATTTVTIGELGLSSSKACVNMNRSDGGPGSFYINAAGQGVFEANYCR